MTDSEVTSHKAPDSDPVNSINGKYLAGQPGLAKVSAAVVTAANVRPGDRVIDLGCGVAPVAIPLAECGARVLAVDGNRALLGRLEATARERSLPELKVLARPIECLSLPPASADLIVSSYAMHRLRDAEKQRVITAAFRWLRPGGTIVIADMMFGRGTTSRDRAIIRSKVRVLAGRGIGGWWRIAKNGCRYLVQMREHPASISAWTTMLARAGFAGITASSIVNEAGLISARRPAEPPSG